MRAFLILSTFFLGFLLGAQEKSEEQEKELVSLFEIEVQFIGLNIEYERKIGRKFTLNTTLGYRVLNFAYDGNTGTDYRVFTLLTEVTPRFYYNINRRLEKGRSIKNNAANYISIITGYFGDILTTEISDNGFYTINERAKYFYFIPSYGFKRNIIGNLNLDLSAGLGYRVSEVAKYSRPVIDLDLKLSYAF